MGKEITKVMITALLILIGSFIIIDLVKTIIFYNNYTYFTIFLLVYFLPIYGCILWFTILKLDDIKKFQRLSKISTEENTKIYNNTIYVINEDSPSEEVIEISYDKSIFTYKNVLICSIIPVLNLIILIIVLVQFILLGTDKLKQL